MVCLALAGCGGALALRAPAAHDASVAGTTGSPVAQPTAAERAAVVADVESVWNYESRPFVAGVPRLTDKPDVVSVRVSRTDPVFASAAVELVGHAGQKEPGGAVIAFEQRHGAWSQYGSANVVAGPAVAFASDCTDTTPVGMRDLLCPNPWSVLDQAAPTPPGYAGYSFPVGTDDLRTVAWQDIALPGAVCGVNHLIQLHKGYATVPGPADGWWAAVVEQLPRETYGELASGIDVASVLTDCNNGGGTADGQLAFVDVVFSASKDSLHVIGLLTAQQPLMGAGSHVPIIGSGQISRGEIVVPESWYGPYDPTCCSTGRAKTVWVYAAGRLTVQRTIVLHEPATKPPSG
jgi:hypothetical protein